ncbi:MAG: AAA family ATPase, partial [Hydrogenophaga sp.]|nr:AAA family ATPase [Hydrogenophaga sp.]
HFEERSRYNFLHAYNAMQVGGALEFNGETYELKRVKQRTNSLLDGRGQPVAEAILSVPLAGISRDAYRTMFSLDDVTLEEGGNAILQSKGDLGELLFSASAGLGGVSATLSAISDEADSLYKKRARSTRIAELKQKLTELKARRDEIDTLASAHAAIVATLAQATTAYDEATTELGAMRARREVIARLLRARPLAAEYQRLMLELAARSALPRPPAEWARTLPSLMQEETRLATQLAGNRTDIERVQAEIASIHLDDRLLSLSDRIGLLSKGQARFGSAEEDLPKRRTALVERQATIAAILARLGQSGCARPETLLLPAATVGALRDLIEIRSGVEATLQTATRELAAAKAALEAADADRKVVVDAAQPETIDISRLTTSLAVIRRGDHATRLRLAERGLPYLQRRFDEAVRPLLPLLDDGAADGEAIRALSLPDARQIEAWRSAAASIDKRIADLAERQRDLITQQRQAEARISALRAAGGPIDDSEAARIRALRDAAWSEHIGRLDKASAETFATAMQADDLTTMARLAAMRDLADLRALTQEHAVVSAAITRHDELLDEAAAEREALVSELAAALPAALMQDAASALFRLFSRIEGVARARADALYARERLDSSIRDIGEAKADAELYRQERAAVMEAAGLDKVDGTLAEMLEAAEAAVGGQAKRAAVREAADKALADRKRVLAERQREFEQAQAASVDWHARFMAALSGTWFADVTSAGAVREVLETLVELGPALNERDELARRIATMERDREDFTAELSGLLAEIGETLDPEATARAAASLAARLEHARRDLAARETKEAELARLLETERALRQALAVHEAGKAELTSFFGVDTLADVAAALEAVAEQARLEARIDTLSEQILGELPAPSIDLAIAELASADFDAIAREEAELAARLEDLDQRTRQLFADKTRAADRLEAIGGGSEVARIEADRRTIFLEIEDLANSYLKLKSGALIAGEALRAYRDKHRSSMMRRASEAFRLITRGDYVGLAAQPDKDRETLIGLTRQGGSKLASEMSKGTQFQLYLALRLAGYEEFAASRPSVPFIADDIMETFDEPRSEEVLRLFGEMAKIGQVIYLTHHRHLCDLARQIVPAVRIHEISV